MDGTTPASQGISDATITTTEDMTDKFVRGNATTSGSTGGSTTMAHTHTDPASSNNGWGTGSGGNGYLVTGATGAGFAQTDLATSAASATAIIPPYYTMVFMMKVKLV